MVNRNEDVKQLYKYENKWKRELKDLKNQSKMIYSMAKRCIPRCELNKIKKIHAKVFKKNDSSSRSSFSSDYDSYLYSYSK